MTDHATHPHTARTMNDPAQGYLDDEFAKFRQQRLAAKKKPSGEGNPAAPAEAEAATPAPAPADEPHKDGYVEDEFAKFRAERIRNTPPRASARLGTRPPTGRHEKKPSGEEPQAQDTAFFGTNMRERIHIKDGVEEARHTTEDLPVAEAAPAAEPPPSPPVDPLADLDNR